MKIDLIPYIQKALEDVAVVDFSAVHASIDLSFEHDRQQNALQLYLQLNLAPDATARFREALQRAGLDDLKVFWLTRAFDQMGRT